MTKPTHDDYPTNARDALALLEASIRHDDDAASAILENCNALALVESTLAIATNALMLAGIPPLDWIAAVRQQFDELGDDGIRAIYERYQQ